MGVEFRNRTPGEYVRILWKRKWLIILPTIAIAAAIAIVVMRLPDVYESTTFVVVKPPTIPDSVVPSLTVDLTLLLNNINQVVTSRSTLEPLIVKYHPFDAVDSHGEPMELLVDYMRKSMRVEIDKSRDETTSGFRISFRGYDPRITQAITAELANKYVAAQIVEQNNTTKKTEELFEQQLKDAKAQLDEIQAKRLEYMEGHKDSLPSEAASMVGQLTALSNQRQALISDIGRWQDQRTSLSSQLSDLKKQSENEVQDVIDQTTDPKTTMAWAELVKRMADLEAEHQRLLADYRPKHPDVIAKEAQIKSVQDQMDKMLAERQERIKEKQDKLSGRVDLRITNLEANLQTAESGIIRQQKLLSDVEGQVATLNARLSGVPTAQVGLESLDREYQTRKSIYDDLLSRQSKISAGVEVTTTSLGEKIQVLDPASLPAYPVAPKRMMLIGMGLGLGLCVGLFLAACFEVPRLLTIQTMNDAEHYTGLPVLISVPDLLTPQEARRIPRRRLLLLAAGILLTIASIPALAMVLKATHFFERFV
jgi:polysaccharide chain length determinant protein (PEP-CTERM system associated)